ncbi:alpha/beta hydrolase, partial [Limnohabitans sp.]|uniref:alpha/beta hydrolase n=1 Tax=Limnohabitans sp. TaxID=1907725 RepID=UPI002FDC9E80
MSHPRNPQSLLTPAMRDVLHAIAKTGRPPLAALSAEQAKQAYALGAGVLEVNAQHMVRDDTLHIPTRDGATLRAKLWAEHAKPNLPVLLYFHGGGFMVGSPETHEALCKHLAHLAHCAVVSLDYRLAPAHTFPTAHNDALDALEWLAANAASLGLDPTRIAIGGDSAGGNLAAAACLGLRDLGLKPLMQLLIYPSTLMAPDTDSYKTNGQGYMLTRDSMAWYSGNYLRGPQDAQDWRASPQLAASHANLPPAFVITAGFDPLR